MRLRLVVVGGGDDDDDVGLCGGASVDVVAAAAAAGEAGCGWDASDAANVAADATGVDVVVDAVVSPAGSSADAVAAREEESSSFDFLQ